MMGFLRIPDSLLLSNMPEIVRILNGERSFQGPYPDITDLGDFVRVKIPTKSVVSTGQYQHPLVMPGAIYVLEKEVFNPLVEEYQRKNSA